MVRVRAGPVRIGRERPIQKTTEKKDGWIPLMVLWFAIVTDSTVCSLGAQEG